MTDAILKELEQTEVPEDIQREIKALRKRHGHRLDIFKYVDWMKRDSCVYGQLYNWSSSDLAMAFKHRHNIETKIGGFTPIESLMMSHNVIEDGVLKNKVMTILFPTKSLESIINVYSIAQPCYYLTEKEDNHD